jgi:hypothetical protein
MMEKWNIGLKTHNFGVWIKVFGINSYEFSMNILIGSEDNDSSMAIMTLPNEWLSLFDAEKPLKAHHTTSWPTPRREYAIGVHKMYIGRGPVCMVATW